MKRWSWMLVMALLAVVPAAAWSQDSGAKKPAGMRVLYLIRHGEYDHRDSADARVGKHLTKLGREQAGYVGRKLKSLPVKLSAVHTSTLTRAMETGDVIGAVLRMPVTRDSLLSECTPPSSRPDIRWDTPGEADSALAQMEAAWAAYVRPSPDADTHEALVCHGNVIRWFATKAIGADTKQWAQMDIGHCSLTIIAVRPDGGTRLVTFSDVGHVPVAKQTWAGRGAGWVVEGTGR